MQRRLARYFYGWCIGTFLFAAVCVTYMYALPSPQTVAIAGEQQPVDVPVASQPARMAFVAFSEESTIRAFWKSPEESTYRFTIEIDPVEGQEPDPGETVEPDGEDATADEEPAAENSAQ